MTSQALWAENINLYFDNLYIAPLEFSVQRLIKLLKTGKMTRRHTIERATLELLKRTAKEIRDRHVEVDVEISVEEYCEKMLEVGRRLREVAADEIPVERAVRAFLRGFGEKEKEGEQGRKIERKDGRVARGFTF